MQIKKYFFIFYAITFFYVSPQKVEAAIWGPSNYDECVKDIVRSAKNSDYAVAQSLCRNQFPKLINLSKKKNAQLACEDVLGKFIYSISVTSGLVSVKELGKAVVETTSYTKEAITFKGTSESKGDKRKVTIYGKVDIVSGFGNIAVEFDDKKSADFVYEFNCLEKT
jgi:hypothetical protein